MTYIFNLDYQLSLLHLSGQIHVRDLKFVKGL